MVEEHRAATILKVLMSGHIIKKSGTEYSLVNITDGIDIGVKADRIEFDESGMKVVGHVWLSCGMTIGVFIRFCSEFTDEEYALVAANLTLNSIRGNR